MSKIATGHIDNVNDWRPLTLNTDESGSLSLSRPFPTQDNGDEELDSIGHVDKYGFPLWLHSARFPGSMAQIWQCRFDADIGRRYWESGRPRRRTVNWESGLRCEVLERSDGDESDEDEDTIGMEGRGAE